MKTIQENTQKHFDMTAKNYDNTFDGRFVQPMYASLLKEIHALSSGKLLDVGCGNGNVLSALAKEDFHLYGIDLSENMVKEAKKQLGSSAEIQVADAANLPYAKDSFDILVCNASFHHYPQPGKVLQEMHRVMKKNSVLLIGEGYAIQPFRFFLNIGFKLSNKGDVRSYGKQELTGLLKDNGFQLTKIEKTGRYSVLYVATAQ